MVPTPIFGQTASRTSAGSTTGVGGAPGAADPGTEARVVCTAGSNGTKVLSITAAPEDSAPIGSGPYQVSLYIGTGVTDCDLYDQFEMATATGSSTALRGTFTRKFDNLVLQSGEVLIACRFPIDTLDWRFHCTFTNY